MRIEPKNILCAIDFSPYSGKVIAYGQSLADHFNAKLNLCHVVSTAHLITGHISPYVDYIGLEEECAQNAHEKLSQMAHEMDTDCEVLVSSGYPAETISRLVDENNIDLVVAATHGGSGIKKFLIGSVTDRLAKILPCPFLILHLTEAEDDPEVFEKIKFDRILVGCDFSSDSKEAVDYAVSLAQEFQAELHLAHVVQTLERGPGRSIERDLVMQEAVDLGPYPWLYDDLSDWPADSAVEKESLTDLIERQLFKLIPEDSRHWCAPIPVIIEGSAYQGLLDYAREQRVDLIVLGVHGHNLFEKFLVGSTTDRVICRASCPVLTVREPVAPAVDAADPETETTSDRQNAELCAKDIMQTKVVSVRPDMGITEAAKLLLKNKVNGVPVLSEEGKIVGILCRSDLIFSQKEIPVPPVFSMLDSMIPLSLSNHMEEELEKISAVTVSQAMTRNPACVSLDAPISAIASLMVEKHFHTIPVVDGETVVGIIGKEDMLGILIY